MLESFDAGYDDSAVRIEWNVSEFTDRADFTIYRSPASELEFIPIIDPYLIGDGTSFTYRDTYISPGTAYKYRVTIMDDPAPKLLFETEQVEVPAMPLTLNQNYPNPFNPSTRITYYLPKKSGITLEIFDVSGKMIDCLVNKTQEHGFHSFDWDGTNLRGANVSSGTYFYRLSSGKKAISKKMILLR